MGNLAFFLFHQFVKNCSLDQGPKTEIVLRAAKFYAEGSKRLAGRGLKITGLNSYKTKILAYSAKYI